MLLVWLTLKKCLNLDIHVKLSINSITNDIFISKLEMHIIPIIIFESYEYAHILSFTQINRSIQYSW